MHHGSCNCQSVRFEITGDFEGFYLCHCSRCRKQTGSAHASNLFSRSATLQWISGSEHVKQFQLQGTRFHKAFCERCGAALPTLQESGRLLVPAGSLDSELTLKPNAHIFMDSRAAWDNGLDSIPKFEKLPT